MKIPFIKNGVTCPQELQDINYENAKMSITTVNGMINEYYKLIGIENETPPLREFESFIAQGRSSSPYSNINSPDESRPQDTEFV